MPLLSGVHVGIYEVAELIGMRGMGEVRFVAVGVGNQTGEASAPRIEVVVNWFEELKRKHRAAK